jgi:lipid-A-disaccharide synthase-like uncharacterized protein
MTHDPNVLNALYFSLDGRFFNYVLTVFFLARYLFQFYACSARSRKLVGLPFYLWSISRVGCHHLVHVL